MGTLKLALRQAHQRTAPSRAMYSEMLSMSLRNLGLMSSSSRLSLASHDKFNGIKYLYGTADSLERFMCVPNGKAFRQKFAEGKQAIIEEFSAYGIVEDKECLNYVLYEEAGSNAKTFQDGLKRDCDANGDVLQNRLIVADGVTQRGMRLEDFVALGKERGIDEDHVLALRLYTTMAYKSINTQIRDEDRLKRKEAFPFPVTVKYIEDALAQLRHGEQGKADKNEAMDLWRGMRDIEIPEEFLRDGGAELAPMSTTSNLEVALRYALRGTTVTLFCVKAAMYLDRGVDISWLSCFPAESEYLYRPITTLMPQKDEHGKPKKYSFDINGRSITVLEVKPKK